MRRKKLKCTGFDVRIPIARIGKRSVRFTRSRLLEWLSEREGVEYRLSCVASDRAEQ
jgi:hypothetical protein